PGRDGRLEPDGLLRPIVQVSPRQLLLLVARNEPQRRQGFVYARQHHVMPAAREVNLVLEDIGPEQVNISADARHVGSELVAPEIWDVDHARPATYRRASVTPRIGRARQSLMRFHSLAWHLQRVEERPS